MRYLSVWCSIPRPQARPSAEPPALRPVLNITFQISFPEVVIQSQLQDFSEKSRLSCAPHRAREGGIRVMNQAQAHGIREQLDRLAIVNDQNPPATHVLSALHNVFESTVS